MPEHKWRLHFPSIPEVLNTLELFDNYTTEERENAIVTLRNLIIRDRRATISTTYTPRKRWLNTPEIHSTNFEASSNGIIEILPQLSMFHNTVVELIVLPNQTQLYQNQYIKNESNEIDFTKLNLLEFFADYENNIIYANLDGFGNNIVFSLRYQTYNYESYKWYVSLVYPQFMFGFTPISLLPLEPLISDVVTPELCDAIIIPVLCRSLPTRPAPIILVLDQDNVVIAFYSYNISDANNFVEVDEVDGWTVSSDFRNRFEVIETESNQPSHLRIRLADFDDLFKIVFFCITMQNDPCPGVRIHSYGRDSRATINTFDFANAEIYRIDRELNSNVINPTIIGQTWNPFIDIKNRLMNPQIIIDHTEIIQHFTNGGSRISNMDDIESQNSRIEERNEQIQLRNEQIREQNLIIMAQNNRHMNTSYFIWQFGREIDNNGFILQHKRTDSPLFACFFNKIEKILKVLTGCQ